MAPRQARPPAPATLVLHRQSASPASPRVPEPALTSTPIATIVGAAAIRVLQVNAAQTADARVRLERRYAAEVTWGVESLVRALNSAPDLRLPETLRMHHVLWF